jgi:tetratricopeptide (TPR) repeat protein
MWRSAALAVLIVVRVLAADAGDLYRQAVDRQRAGDLAGAVVLYEECLRQDPSNIQARSNLGAALSGLQRYGEAIEAYEEALKSAPEPMRPYLQRNLGLAYYKAARMKEASRVFTSLLESQPDNRDIALLAADADMQLGEPAKALEALKPLASAAHDDAGIAYLLGTATFALQDYAAAAQAFSRAAVLAPALPKVNSYYGQALLFTGDSEGAANAFRKQLTTNPDDFHANLYLGEIMARRSLSGEAEPLLRRALELKPDSAEARRALEETRAGHFTVGPLNDAGVPVGTAAPEVSVERLDSRASMRLPEAGRASVLVFGSYTCPQFRSAAPELDKLAAQYSGRVRFWLVYIREAHASGEWQSSINERENISLSPAATIEQKHDYARMCTRKLRLSFPATVDGIDATAEKIYGAWPSRVYVIGSDGKVRFASGLSDAELDAPALERAVLSVAGAQ